MFNGVKVHTELVWAMSDFCWVGTGSLYSAYAEDLVVKVESDN